MLVSLFIFESYAKTNFNLDKDPMSTCMFTPPPPKKSPMYTCMFTPHPFLPCIVSGYKHGIKYFLVRAIPLSEFCYLKPLFSPLNLELL